MPNTKSTIVPTNYEYFLNNLFIYLPKDNPKKVNEKLHNENTVDDNNKLFVIALSPKPTVKLSIETPNAKNNAPYLLSDISLFVGFKYSINSCRDNNNKIIPKTKSESINKS